MFYPSKDGLGRLDCQVPFCWCMKRNRFGSPPEKKKKNYNKRKRKQETEIKRAFKLLYAPAFQIIKLKGWVCGEMRDVGFYHKSLKFAGVLLDQVARDKTEDF
ncbi:hypothetical protein CEXT_387461 [Caerostris extrusa]|uniref:Uncharacterized protein n=1 Tax=Caerostris extrusa TaxID=172846 RepID=A0AAV4P6W9_CAEEX|nr:hypothetical protein CEXT_387461 [Caerostris extrusa]